MYPQQFDHQLQNFIQMEEQNLGTKLTNMLEHVEPPEMYDEFRMQCIYRVPPDIRETNPKAYTPRIVSIGPFHKASDAGKEGSIFETMEELKVNYLKAFLNRTHGQVPAETFVDKLQKLEDKIRSSYAVRIKYNSDDFLKMILIDACFIIELFLRYHTCSYCQLIVDPLLLKPWMLTQICRDLILLENQLPFFVLKKLYKLAGMNREFPSFLEISFSCLMKNVGYGTCHPTESPKHFTDLLRTCIISSSKFDLRAQEDCKEITLVYSASRLREAGLKFKVSPNENECLLDLTYSNEGVLTMPILKIGDDTEIFFRNIVAFEHCHFPYNQKIITQYRKILDSLINTEKDVNVLVEKKIIVNCMGDANAVATMVNSLGTNLDMPAINSHYSSLCKSLNDFYESPCNKYKATFIHEYFNTPWKIASTVAAIMLLLFTLIQTICSFISLF